tara:strand:- start:567 stop:944 length:378 start_codon:yes stop_codon:yes gene_type:complete
MESIDIKGKQYITVNERVKEFRRLHPQGQILTSILANVDSQVMFKAEIVVEGVTVSTGHAYEKEGSSFINKTSYIENCETSAIGRALGMYGIGIDTSLASADEVQNAVKQQDKSNDSQEEGVFDL